MKYLALDIGDVRIGVARSDIMGIIASPLEVIDRKKLKLFIESRIFAEKKIVI